MQTGSFLHYEVNETLFMFNPFVKHQPQSEQSSMLIMMPYTEQGDAMFPHRWGMSQYVIGEWQVENMPTKNFFMDSLDYQVRTTWLFSFPIEHKAGFIRQPPDHYGKPDTRFVNPFYSRTFRCERCATSASSAIQFACSSPVQRPSLSIAPAWGRSSYSSMAWS
jgi:hypothetical protein